MFLYFKVHDIGVVYLAQKCFKTHDKGFVKPTTRFTPPLSLVESILWISPRLPGEIIGATIVWDKVFNLSQSKLRPLGMQVHTVRVLGVLQLTMHIPCKSRMILSLRYGGILINQTSTWPRRALVDTQRFLWRLAADGSFEMTLNGAVHKVMTASMSSRTLH